MLPSASMIKPAIGFAPSEQSVVQKLCKTFSLPSAVTSKTVPQHPLPLPPYSVVP